MLLGYLRSVANRARCSLLRAWLFCTAAVCATARLEGATACRSSADASYPPPGDGTLHVMADRDD